MITARKPQWQLRPFGLFDGRSAIPFLRGLMACRLLQGIARRCFARQAGGMHERLTDRARKVMLLANQEAMRFNHEYIGTEHVLLGLIKEGGGVAAHVLKNLDIKLREVRLDVERIMQSGPDRIIKGKLPQTPRAKKVIEYSMEEARTILAEAVAPRRHAGRRVASTLAASVGK